MWDHETIMMIVQGVGETLYMTVLSTVLGYLFGLPMGVLLAVSDKEGLKPNAVLYKILDAIANIVRSIYVVMLIPVQSLSTTANSLVSNLIGAGGVSHVMQLMGRIARMSFIIMVVCVAVLVVFPQAMLSVYTNEESLLIESVPSLYVIGGAMLIASVANIYFNGISGTGNTQAALILETVTLVIYTSYIFWIGYIVKAPVSVCFSTEVIYYALLLICSVIYLKKAKWQNKKI